VTRAPARPFTGPQLALVIAVCGLVVVFAVMLLARAWGAEGRDGGAAELRVDASPAAPPASPVPPAQSATPAESPVPAEAPTPPEAPSDAEPQRFRSPSGNIECAISVDSAGCVIASFDFDPADGADCANGGYLRVEPAGAFMPCEGAPDATGAAAQLDYGSELTAHGYTCSSERSGVTCRHLDSGYGFAVARAGYELF